LDELQKVLSREFSTSWSLQGALIVLAFFVVVALLIWYFSRREAIAAEGVQRGDPRRLFRDLLRRLSLSASQRRWLNRVAEDLRLAHPATLLLSPALFQHYTQTWRADQAADSSAEPPPDLAPRIHAILFPVERA
jgi:hypothetical protein